MSSSRLTDDLSSRARLGFAGPGASTVLRELSLIPPDVRFGCWEQSDGSLLVKLNTDEFLWLSGPPRQSAAPWLHEAPADTSNCFRLHWRSSHAWFSMTGAHAHTTLAELCALDLHPSRFANLTCAPTMLARIPILVIRWDTHPEVQFHLLVPRPHAAAVLDWLERRDNESPTHA